MTRAQERTQGWQFGIVSITTGADPSPAIMEVGRRLRLNDPDDPYQILARAAVEEYMESYFRGANVGIYWGRDARVPHRATA